MKIDTLKENTLKDKRYSIDLEFCGLSTRQHVVRFCGSWVGSRPSKESAEQLATDHNRKRIGL
jgi:hypothetical protein